MYSFSLPQVIKGQFATRLENGLGEKKDIQVKVTMIDNHCGKNNKDQSSNMQSVEFKQPKIKLG